MTGMKTIALLTTRAPDPITEQLMLAGYKVHEAVSVEAVLQLFDTEDIDAVVIVHGVEDPEIPDLQTKLAILKLNENATAKDVIWELSQLFRTGPLALQ